ncbi:superoxide dismutase family protein [Salinisphaera sp. T5B8]|uniref:superoxide dismutase family protein n=1 Tax=Salinisphaera sp. T5B8 TaxID=1304154 RepID=UPI0033409866
MMKSLISVSAAMLLAMSLTACGDNNDDQNQANAADTGTSAETNTASENSNEMGADNATENESSMGDDEMMNGEREADDTADSDPAATSSTSASEDMPQAAIAVLHGTEGNDDVTATIRFTPEDGGVAYTTEAEGLAPGKHGYHIHLYGDCSAPDGTSAGTHFNLKGSSKNPPKDIDRITGDLGDLDAGDDGNASDEGMLAGASLTGAKALIGRGVIIHAKPNDPSQPPIGAAGSRQACGVIGIAEAGNTGMDTNTADSSDSSMSNADSETGSDMEDSNDDRSESSM